MSSRSKKATAVAVALCAVLGLVVSTDDGGRRSRIPTRVLGEDVARVPVPVEPYISKAQLDNPPPGRLSFYSQPWRGYLETVSAKQFLDGIGVNYSLPADANHDAVLKLLSNAGFRAIRIEVPWDVDWSEQGLVDARRAHLQAVLTAAKRHGITPLILLNAHHGGPGPHQTSSRVVVSGGNKGSRTLVLNSTEGLVPNRSGLDNATDFWMAEIPFTSIDGNTVTLGKPLPLDIAAGTPRSVSTLKYLPLHRVGTPEFEATAAAWLRYASIVFNQVRANGFPTFEVEIWNELTFGSRFLSSEWWNRDVLDPDTFRPGGAAYELAKRTVDLMRRNYSEARAIWGYSNTAFYHTPVTSLPGGTDGQSYHPYGTSKARFPSQLEFQAYFDYVPRDLTRSMPEGWPHLALKNEQLPRNVLQPAVRAANRPPGTSTFHHYMTEHGSHAKENGITDPAAAYAFKAKSLIRFLPFWLNKGITKLHAYTAYDPDPLSYGLLYSNPRPGDYGRIPEDQVLSPPLRALRNMVGQFQGAQPLASVRQVGVQVASLGPQHKVFEAEGLRPPLYYRDMFAFLPFQVSPTKFAIPAYVMSYDATNPPPPMDFRVTIENVRGVQAAVSLHDPMTGTSLPVQGLVRGANSVTFTMTAMDYPRVIVVDEAAGPPPVPSPTISDWQPLGGYLTSGPDAASWGNGRRDVFVRGGDNQLWHRAWSGSTWSGWSPLGGYLTSGPDVASWGPGRLDVFARGGDNQLWHRAWVGSTWTQWSPLGGYLTSDPAAVSSGPNRLDVFVRGGDNQLWRRAWLGSGWSGWEPLGGHLTSGPDVASRGGGRLDVFVRGPDNGLHQKSFDGRWSDWRALGGRLTSDPGAVSSESQKIDVFVRGPDNGLHTMSLASDP